MSDPRVTLYGRPGCHLCDDARAVVERVCAELGESYEEISILDDPALLERYAEEIPVTLVDGRQHDFWRVDEARLAGRPALQSAMASLTQHRRGQARPLWYCRQPFGFVLAFTSA